VNVKTPGQAAYEAYVDALRSPGGYAPLPPWSDLETQAGMEAAAQAAIEAGTATYHDGCTAVIAGLEASRDALHALVAEILDSWAAVDDRGPAIQAQIARWRERAGLETRP
jgi:hypothetical protein